jgi:Zn finger protein HypA/HybF involved in hydrogenase expression
MALIKCKECSNEISTEAAACPKCGGAYRKLKAKEFLLLDRCVCDHAHGVENNSLFCQ